MPDDQPARRGRRPVPLSKRDLARLPFFAQKLRELREARGLSYTDLEAATGLTDQAIINYERGAREPTLSRAAAIAKALGVPLTDLIDPSFL